MKIKQYLYLKEDFRKQGKINNLPFLFADFKYKSNITCDDLPKWYIEGKYYNREGYLSAKNILDFKYIAYMYDNFSLKRDVLIIFYENKKVYHVEGMNITNMILACEKYMNKDLTYLKLKLNYKFRMLNKGNKIKVEAFEDVKEDKIFVIADKIIKVLIKNKLSEKTAIKLFLLSKLSDELFSKNEEYCKKNIDELVDILKEETNFKIKEIYEYEEEYISKN